MFVDGGMRHLRPVKRAWRRTAAAIVGATMVTMVASEAMALSCYAPQPLYFMHCEDGRCVGLFRTGFVRNHGCLGRVVLEPIEAWEVEALNDELARRGSVPEGVVQVDAGHLYLFPPERELEHAAQLEVATVEPVAATPEALHREWNQKARDQLKRVVILRLPIWGAFFALLAATLVAARQVWRHVRGRAVPIAGALGLQTGVVALGIYVTAMADDGSGAYLGAGPVALAGLLALLLLVAELVALAVARWRTRLRSTD
jgi:hypothetical protein